MALKPAMHGRDHCPDGQDPIPCIGNTPWIAANGIFDASSLPSTPAWDNLWEGVYLDENPVTAGVFDYSTLGGGGYNALGSFGLYILTPGVYTFTLQAMTSDLSEGTGYDIYYALELAHSSNAFPNWYAASNTSNGWISWERSVTPVAGSSGQLMFTNSITTPIYMPGSFPAVSQLKTGRVSLGDGTVGVPTNTWTFQIWIMRHGSFTWSAGNFLNPTAGL